jgi:Zn-dependent protease
MEATITEKLSLFLVLVCSLSVHEWAHAFVADKMGDSTPRAMGRLTLNPIAHIDLIGTILLPLIMMLCVSDGLVFGWGRPVLIDPRNFKNRAAGDILTSLAGPFANLGIALVAAVAFGLALGSTHDGEVAGKLALLGANIISLNVMLAVFNLLPIPPLDGSQVLRHLFRMSEMTFARFSQWSFVILLILIYLPGFQAFLSFLIDQTSAPFGMLMQGMAGLTMKLGGG